MLCEAWELWRLINAGSSGYFDVRDAQDKWVRIDCQKGDMIVLPEGIYHRFTLDSNNYVKVRRSWLQGQNHASLSIRS